MRTEIALCACLGVVAVLDELTLTYDIVERGPGGRTRVLRRYVASLREARTYACAACAHH